MRRARALMRLRRCWSRSFTCALEGFRFARLTPDDAIIATPCWYATPLFYAAYAERSPGYRPIVTNVGHADIAALAKIAQVFYIPLPENDIAIDGVTLDPVPAAWPTMYHVVPKR
jgi:hypothetical protein